MHLSYDDLTRLGAVDLHFEGTINMARSIEDVEVALLFREIEPGVIKIGFRSKQEVDVNRIAGVWGGEATSGLLELLCGRTGSGQKVVLLKVEEHLP